MDVERAAAGAMASVWRARIDSGPVVAIKRMLPALANNAHLCMMFDDECRVHSSLRHPHVVGYVDHGADESGRWLAMQWIDGPSARYFVDAERRLSPCAAARLGLDVLDALAALHRAGAGTKSAVIHRDISPANVLVGTDGMARLADFGLARSLVSARSTAAGTTVGKLAYLPPEVLHGKIYAARGDLYALGVVLWEVLAGRRLWSHERDAVLRARAMRARPRPLLESAREALPAALCAVVNRALESDPAKRFPSAVAMAAALRAALPEEDIERGRAELSLAANGRHVRKSRRRVARG